MKFRTQLVVAIAVAAIAGISTPALAGSKSTRSSGSASVAAPVENAASPDAATRTFPARLRQPDLSRVRQVAGEIARTRGASLASNVRLCVVPSGAVSAVKLVKSSGFPAFDMAVLDTASSFIYAAYPAPAGVRTCSVVSIVYRAR